MQLKDLFGPTPVVTSTTSDSLANAYHKAVDPGQLPSYVVFEMTNTKVSMSTVPGGCVLVKSQSMQNQQRVPK